MIRNAAQADLDAVLAIEEASYTTPWSRTSFWAEFSKDYAHFLVYESDGMVIGYLVLYVVLDEAEIANIAVHPARRGQGIARALMDEAVRLLPDGADCYLEVEATNSAAIALYEKYGFIGYNTSRNYYGAGRDALLMKRQAQII